MYTNWRHTAHTIMCLNIKSICKLTKACQNTELMLDHNMYQKHFSRKKKIWPLMKKNPTQFLGPKTFCLFTTLLSFADEAIDNSSMWTKQYGENVICHWCCDSGQILVLERWTALYFCTCVTPGFQSKTWFYIITIKKTNILINKYDH